MTQSFYKFERQQAVETLVPKYGLSVGRTGQIIARRGIKGVPQYLVKFLGKARPCHFEEQELTISSDNQ